MHLTLCFSPDGGCDFYPDSTDPPELARRFRQMVQFLVEHPSILDCAADHHRDARG